MKIINKKILPNFITYTLLSNNKTYQINYLDKVYLCECALINNRNIKKECKHIKYIKENE